MDKDLLQKMRKLNWIMQESQSGDFSVKEICEILGSVMETSVYIVDNDGVVLGSNVKEVNPNVMTRSSDRDELVVHKECNDRLLKFDESGINISAKDLAKDLGLSKETSLSNGMYVIIPIRGGKKRWGTLVSYRKDLEYDTGDVIVAETGATIVGIEIQRLQMRENEKQENLRSIAQLSIGTLSYSEIDAVKRIFTSLGAEEGLLVASKIADEAGITRSVIVNALRKLQSAGLIETRSLGMKGTYIRVVNPKFTEELGKIKI